jgi:hypothetical protein
VNIVDEIKSFQLSPVKRINIVISADVVDAKLFLEGSPDSVKRV